MKIESNDKKVEELLKGSTFVIPRFQRPYSWEAEQIVQFWSDLQENLGESYFIGSMVVYKMGRSSLAVVDGQQRLTTIAILLCAIRETYKELGETELASGLQGYIEQRTRENKSVYVLQTETSFPFLQEIVFKNGEPDINPEVGREEEAIQRAFDLFRDKIGSKILSLYSIDLDDKANREEAISWLNKFRDTVFDLNVIVVTLDNEDDAYLIFETLNTRGKDLALSDLIRNHFTKFLKPKAGVDPAVIKWSEVLSKIGGSAVNLDADTFIVHSWQSRYDFVTKAKTFPRVRQQVTAKNAKEHLDQFVRDADYWRSIFDPEYGWEKKEREAARSIRSLRLFKVVQPTPGVLSLIRAYRSDELRYKHFRDALRMIEKFHFSFNAVTSSRSSGGISAMYASFGRAIFSSSNVEGRLAAIRELKEKLKEREPFQSEFDAGFEQILYTAEQTSQRSLVYYILRGIALHEGQPSVGDTEELTIEHLLPQSSKKDGVSERVYGQLGNLILVDAKTNGLLADKKFHEKKKILADRGYKLPELLIQARDIDEALIRNNTMRMAELSRSVIWKVE